MIAKAHASLLRMGLKVFVSGKDYPAGKPDMIAIYPDKDKFYLIECIADDCLFNPAGRLNTNRPDGNCRKFYSMLYNQPRLAVWATAVYCDLGQGIELFEYKELHGINFASMNKYAALVYPSSLAEEAENTLPLLKLQYRSLDVAGRFIMTLFSQTDSTKLGEAKRFSQFLMGNTLDV